MIFAEVGGGERGEFGWEFVEFSSEFGRSLAVSSKRGLFRNGNGY
jgi:hypothetical protein